MKIIYKVGDNTDAGKHQQPTYYSDYDMARKQKEKLQNDLPVYAKYLVWIEPISLWEPEDETTET